MTEVLVVGAGPTGLTLACELWRHGTPCRVIDRRGVPVDRSRAVDVQARTLEVFRRIGVVDEVLASGRRLEAMSIYDGAKRLARLAYSADGAPYPFAVSLPQTITEEILERRLVQLGGKVERGCRLHTLEQNEHCVAAELTQADGEAETVEASWVVGCDGVASTVREQMGIEFEGKSPMRSFTAADATIAWHLPDNELSLFISDTGFLLALPLPEPGRARIISNGAPDEGESGDAEALQRMASAHMGAHLTLHATGFVATYYVQRRLAQSFQVGRVFLAGDAAHTFDPVGGHGMNQGIQGAHNLGWKLSRVSNNKCSTALLGTYQSEHRPVVNSFSRELDFAARLKLSQLQTDADTHNRLMEFASRGAPLRRSLLDASMHPQQMYPKGIYVREEVASGFESRRGAMAGCRAPDVVYDDATDARLSQLFSGTRHTVLLFAGASGTVGLPLTRSLLSAGDALLETLPQLLDVHLVVAQGTKTDAWTGPILHDSNGIVHERYAATLPCVYVIRPDDHIAYRSCPLDSAGLRSYIAALFG